MDNRNKDIKRNRPAEERRGNDPHIRDESGQQPGTNTMSSSDTDDVNQHLTRTASDDFRTERRDPRADPTFDEMVDPDANE